jgi:signal peptidase II
MDETPAGRAQPSRRTALVVGLVATAVVVVVLDQLTKAWAVRSLADGSTVDVLGQAVQLRLFRNPGAAFSFATGTTWIFTLVATAASVAIVRLSRRLGSAWWALALGLLLGGAVGNLLDRLFREPAFAQGHVVDFIDLPRLFVFNVADAAITTAAALLGLLAWRGVRFDGTTPPDAGTSDAGTSDAGTSEVGTSDAGSSEAGTSAAESSDADTSDARTSAAGSAAGTSGADPSDAEARRGQQ